MKKAKSKRAPKSPPALQAGLDFVSMYLTSFMAAMCAGMMHDAMQKVLYAKPESKAKRKVKRSRLRVVK